MATENVEDWDVPLPVAEDASDEPQEEEEDLTQTERRYVEQIAKLRNYVEMMAHKQVLPVKASSHTECLSKPRKKTLIDNAKQFKNCMVPPERAERLKHLAAKHETINVEQLENIIRTEKTKERRKESILKRKEEIYYNLLTKLELQCRTQYLNLVLKKFANFIAKLSTTMRIPPKLFDPYARMQRGLFHNILQSIGVEPTTQTVIYYNTKEGNEYAVCHKLSHALLSLIIKALDLASTRIPEEDANNLEPDCKMDNYIKDRLMRAAEKKILCNKNDKRNQFDIDNLDKKLDKYVCKL